jgi:putative ABC transport system permease protein
MRRRTYLKLATNILLHSKIRSWLTIIGIVIGVGAVVTIMSISASMSADMESRLADMDLTTVTVTPGYTRAFSAMGPPGGGGGGSSSSSDDAELTNKDLRALKLVDNIDYMYGKISGRESVYYNMGKSAELSITGVDPQVWQYTVTYDLDSGRLLEPTDKFVAVIGYRVANDMYDSPVGLNRVITVNGKSVRVIGILASGEDDNANVVTNVETVVEDVENKLMISRHIMNEKDRDFSVSDSLSMAESASEMMSSMSLFLGAIAGVSLIVGSVGIANTMFTSVMEKTREIGTMKAIGAKNRDIMMIFLVNSALVGFVGGVLGIVLSLGLTSLLPSLGLTMMRSSMGSTLSPELMLLGISIAVFIGIISGVVPAYNASKMRPVDALRYE